MVLSPPQHQPSRFKDLSSTHEEAAHYFSDESLADDPRKRRIVRIENDLVKQYLDALPAGAVVADIPCGNGRMSQFVARRGDLRLVAMDYNVTMLDAMASRGEPAMLGARVRADALAIPLPDKSADLTINMRLLHHITEDATRLGMLREVARITRGTVITSFWTTRCWRYLRRRLLGKPIRAYPMTQSHFEQLCEQAHLSIQRVVPVRRWWEEQVMVVCQPR